MFDSTMTPDEEALPVPEVGPDRAVSALPGGQVIDLPSGYRVAIKPTRAIRNRDRKTLFVGVDFNGEDRAASGFVILSNILRLLVSDWDVRDYDETTGEPTGPVLPVPATTDEDVLGLLSIEDASALDEVAQAVQKVLMPNFEPSPDPASPTQPFGG